MNQEIPTTAAAPTPAEPLCGALETHGALEVWRRYIESFDGLKLFAIRWSDAEAEASESPVVVLMHGFGEHAERYHELARALVGAGHPVCAIDARGHGQSDGRRGHVEAYSDYVEDLRLLFDHVAARYPERSRVLLGHSNGGLIAVRFTQTYPSLASALVLSAPLMGLALKVPAWKGAVGRLMSRYAPKLTLANEIRPEDVTRSPEVVKAYASDPRVHHVASTRYFTELLAAMEGAHEGAGTIKLPTLVLQGDADRIVDAESVRSFFNVLGSDEKTLSLLPGLYHELYNEPERASLQTQTIEWIAAHGD